MPHKATNLGAGEARRPALTPNRARVLAVRRLTKALALLNEAQAGLVDTTQGALVKSVHAAAEHIKRTRGTIQDHLT